MKILLYIALLFSVCLIATCNDDMEPESQSMSELYRNALPRLLRQHKGRSISHRRTKHKVVAKTRRSTIKKSRKTRSGPQHNKSVQPTNQSKATKLQSVVSQQQTEPIPQSGNSQSIYNEQMFTPMNASTTSQQLALPTQASISSEPLNLVQMQQQLPYNRALQTESSESQERIKKLIAAGVFGSGIAGAAYLKHKYDERKQARKAKREYKNLLFTTQSLKHKRDVAISNLKADVNDVKNLASQFYYLSDSRVDDLLKTARDKALQIKSFINNLPI